MWLPSTRTTSAAGIRDGQVELPGRRDEPVAFGDDHDRGDGDLPDPLRRREPQHGSGRLLHRGRIVAIERVEQLLLERAVDDEAGQERPGSLHPERPRDEAGGAVQLLQGADDGPPIGARAEVRRRRTQDESQDSIGVAAPHELRDRATHGVADEDRLLHAEDLDERDGVVGTVLERERHVGPDAPPVTAVVEGDDAEVLVEHLQARPPVESTRGAEPVQHHDGRRVGRRAGQVAGERAPAPGQVDRSPQGHRGGAHAPFLPPCSRKLAVRSSSARRGPV